MSKRLRLVLAPVVAILLVLQSVMPGVLAHEGVAEAPVPNVVASDDSASTPPSEGDEEDTGEPQESVDPEPGTGGEAGEGDETGNVGEEDGSVDDNNSIEEEAPVVGPEKGEGEDALPADASRSSVMAQDASSNALPGVTGVTVPPALENVCDNLRIDGTWAVDNPAVGDRFTFTFDNRLNVTPGLPRALPDRNNPSVIVGYVSISGNVATFELTAAVEGRDYVEGTFWLESSGCWGEDYAGETVTLNFSASNGQTWERDVSVPEAPPPPVNTTPTKSGVLEEDGDTITWTVSFPAGPANGATIEDLAGDDWAFVPGSFVGIAGGGATPSVVENGDGSITVTVGAYTEGTAPSFTIKAQVAEDFRGDLDPGTSHTFYNTINGTVTGLDGKEVDMTKVTASVTKVGPPVIHEPGTEPTKSGRFTRDDQGRLITEGAIEWTVYFPAGSSGGATITDTVPEGAGWEFDLDSIEYLNDSGDVTVTLVTEESSATKIVVTTTGYNDQWNPPGFKIRANITNPEAVSFSNSATAENTTVGGEMLEPGTDEIEVPRTDVPPTNTTPTKSGEFTDDVTITWTVRFPVGSADAATITDSALAGWEFDLDSFQAIDTGGGTVELAESSTPGSITVTVDEYIASSNAPGFTIKATLVDGWEDLVEYDADTGQAIFKNRADVTTTPYGGGDPETGLVEAEVRKPLPPTAPETGEEPEKSGKWTDPSNQGFDREGAIEWTIMVPHGPASSATITDTAGENWEFVCDTDNPNNSIALINGWGVGSFDVQCSTDELVVTFTNITSDQWNPVGFTVLASTTVPFADGQGFNNTVFSVINNVTGTVTKEGQVTSDWLVQDSDYGGEGGGGSRVLPMAPTVADAVCEDGVDPDPTIVLPANSNDITYSVFEEIDLDTGDYVVKATKTESKIWGLLPGGWSINPENEHEAFYNGNVEIIPCESSVVELVLPTADAAVCEGGVDPDPTQGTVVTGEATDLVSYEVTSPINEEGVYVVTATKDANAQWPADLGEWVPVDGNPNQVTYTGQVEIVPCEVVELVLPTADAAVCEGGVDPDPTQGTVVTGEATDLVSYEVTSPINEEGVYVVTATKDANAQWPADLGEWVPVDGNPNQVTYTGQVEIVPCDPVVPVAPEVVGNVCEGGFYTPAEAVAADGPEGVTYSDLDAEGGRITATATLSDGQKWDTSNFVAPGEIGWSIDPEDATVAHYIGTYQEAPCAPIIPVDPVVNQAVCTGGELIDPVVTVVDTDRIKYSKSGEEVSGGTVIVTATLEDGYEWDIDEMPEGWTVNPENPAEATFVVELEDIDCTPVVPVIPTIEGNVCVGGVYIDPTIAANGPEGVVYSNGVAEGGTITITATVEPGYAWDAENMPEGWTIDEENPGVAHYEGEYEEAPCTPIVPELPEVTPAVCTGGELIDPVVTVVDTDRIKYSKSGEEVSGGTVIVTATLEDGYEWDIDEMPEGWTVNPENPAEATFVVELEDIDCTPVVPVIPTIEGNVCVGGVYIDPTIAANGPEGVTYTTLEIVDGQIIAVAELADGYAWNAESMPEGWTIDEENLARATYSGEFVEAPCTPVVPGIPEVTPAVCEDDKVVPPSVELPTTPGVTYTKDGEEVPGGTVVITGELEDGYEWGELPEGWTLVDPTTATFTVTFDTISCEVEKPAEEKPAKVTELPKTGTGVDDNGLGIVLASMAGLMLVVVALRLNAYRRS